MLNKLFVVLALALVVIQPARAEQWQVVQERGFLRIGVYRDYLPFAYTEAGRTRGVDVDLGKALAEKMGLAAAIMQYTADENVEDDLRNIVWKGHYLGTATSDVMMHVPVDPVLEDDKVRIFAPYYRAEVAVVFDPEQIASADRLEIFNDNLVGVETDSLSDHYLTSFYGGRYRENVRHFMTAADAAMALRAQQIVAFMGPLTHIQGALGGDVERYRVGRPVLRGLAASGWNVGVAVKIDSGELQDRVDAAMRALREEGTVARIFAEHHLTYTQPR